MLYVQILYIYTYTCIYFTCSICSNCSDYFWKWLIHIILSLNQESYLLYLYQNNKFFPPEGDKLYSFWIKLFTKENDKEMSNLPFQEHQYNASLKTSYITEFVNFEQHRVK